MDPSQAVGDTDEETKKLQEFLEADDDDFVYRLVGVQIHRGVANGGHYWSLINTVRGKEEPDPNANFAKWKQCSEESWKEFNDEKVTYFSPTNLDKEAYGGNKGYSASDNIYASSFDKQDSYGQSAYMLFYERKNKRKLREVVLPADAQQNQQEEEKVKEIDFREVEPYVPDWIRTDVEKENLASVIDRQVYDVKFFTMIKLLLKHISSRLVMT